MVKPSKSNDNIHRRYSMRSHEGHAEISFRVKCVAVENERVFGDVIVTQQTPRYVPQITGFGDEVCPPRFERKDRNQVHQILETPDFMALNRKRANRHRCSVPTEDRRYQILRRSKSADDKTNEILESENRERVKSFEQPSIPKEFPVPRIETPVDREKIVSTLVDQLLIDIYGQPGGDRGRSESESTVSSARLPPKHRFLQLTRLSAKNVTDLRILLKTLQEHIDHVGGQLVRHLRKKDHLIAKRDKRYDVITAHLQARSEKRSEDTRMKFSVAPQPGESGFTQWLDAMKMVARLPGGIPPEFRKRLWLTLSERHLHQRGVDWRQAEKLCFNEWSNPDDEELGIQIVKDLHRTGCSLFCGAAGRDNQAVLRRVLLGFARWNKSVGYCQGLNVLAALILQVVDRAEAAAVKVMIYLIEGVLPEGYFADNLRGLSVDMAVFRDLLRMRLPKLSRHLEALQTDAKDKATGSSYEPPLTNVFTMQWFLTLFCHCLPQEAVLRVWDLIFLEGDEVLLRTALAIWEGLADRIMTVTSADEFYSIMGVLTREMLEFTDTNNLVKAIVGTGPLTGVTNLREKHRYNITPWARRLSDDDDTETEEDERLAMAAAIFGMTQRGKRDRELNSASSLQTVAASNDRDRLALDISTLKQQYAKLRERQRQAHIILSAACARQSMVTPAASQAMNHLLVGKSALVSGKGRQLGLSQAAVPSRARLVAPHSPRNPNRKDKQGVTLHWKDTKRRADNTEMDSDEGTPPIAVTSTPEEMSTESPTSARPSASADSDSDSTSTELCDEPDRLSDVDSEEPTSTSDCYAMATDDEKSPRRENSQDSESCGNPRGSTGSEENSGRSQPATTSHLDRRLENADATSSFQETSIAEITDQIRRLSTDKEGPSSYDFANGSTKTELSRHASTHAAEDVPDRTTRENMASRTTEKPSTVADSFDFLENHGRSIEAIGMPAESDIRAVFRNEYDLPEAAPDLRISRNINAVSEQLVDSDSRVMETDVKVTSNERDSQTFLLVAPDLNVSDFDENASSSFSTDESFVTSTNSRNDASVSRSEMAIIDRTQAASYVVGHVPISPMMPQRKSTYATEYSSRGTVPYDAMESVDARAFEGAKCDSRTSEANDDAVLRIRQGSFDRDDESGGDGLQRKLSVTRSYAEKSHSPKTPGSSEKSFSSGETAGPDSKNSSLTASPRTPVNLESREFHREKSADSSVSSESKTLTLRSIVSDESDGRAMAKGTRSYFAKTSPSSLSGRESIGGKSGVDPKLETSSSSDSCSPERKKSSERSFSSDLQSPVSANSIKFTSNCKRSQSTFSDSPVNLCSAVSPFYPISHPNQKTPSPYGSTKLKSSATDSAETSPEQKSTASSKSSTRLTSFKPHEDYAGKLDGEADYNKDRAEDYRYGFVATKSQMSDADFDAIAKRGRSVERDSAELYGDAADYLQKYRKDEHTRHDESSDRYTEKDTVSPLPGDKKDPRCGFSDKTRSLPDKDKTKDASIGRDYAKPFERSSSSVDKKFTELKLSSSTGEFEANSLKKRSSDILEELRHLEAKTSTDGASEAGLLTKKSSGILEDLKSLEARRQDTFSDSVGGFSKGRLGDMGTNVTMGERKTYVIEPKMELRKDSDSILNNLARSDNEEATDDKEPKLGVWTKVKPRKRSDNGRRSSERALKIIQENSAILHRILTCQAKKRLPDLEQISKNITISPINEEISKIFSPILEKIGLNEHEINEELARINFKDFDQMSVTSGSEFDAKINDELSKLSLIDDSEEIDHLDLDDALSRDYLDTREALIDRQINEELSKLLANYEEGSPTSSVGIHRQEECSSMQNASELEGLDLSSISTNVFSHKSSSDSIETKSDLGSIQETIIRPEKLYDYKDRPVVYPPPKYNLQDVSPKIDIDIYRELEKLDKISSGELFPRMSTSTKLEVTTVDPYASESLDSFAEKTPPGVAYASKSEHSFDSTPLRSPYDTYKPYDFKSRISPHQTPGSGYSARSYEKSGLESRFEFDEHKSSVTAPRLSYDPSSERAIISKEALEFRVRYDEEPLPKNKSDEPASRPYHLDLTDASKGAAYYETNTAVTPLKYLPADRPTRISEAEILSPIDYKYSKTDFYHRKYQDNSTKEYSYHQPKSDYQRTNPYALSSPSGDEDFAAQLSIRRRESHSLSPTHQSANRKPPTAANTYLSKLSPSLEDVAKRPVSHPEFPDKLTAAKFADHSNHGSDSYKKSSLSLGNIGHASRVPNISLEKTPSPKSQFNPFPVRNAARKPKELALKLGLYSPTSPGNDTLKRLH